MSVSLRGGNIGMTQYFLHIEKGHSAVHFIHRKIVNGELKIPQFANLRVRVLEAFVSTIDKGKLLDARGSFSGFGPNGKVQLSTSRGCRSGFIDFGQS